MSDNILAGVIAALISGPILALFFFFFKEKVFGIPQVNDENQRNISLLLGLGIFILPYIFFGLLLRSGYSNSSRIISFAWMLFLIYTYGSKTI